jgi:hypothetical protein
MLTSIVERPEIDVCTGRRPTSEKVRTPSGGATTL